MQKSSHLVQPKLLLVDDDPSITEAVTAMFEKEGYAVYAVHSGNAAIEETSKGFYHVALVDIKLPDMMGIELLDKLRTVNPRMIVIIVTGYPTLDNAIQALNLGADAYIMKPFDPRGLVLTVKEKVDDNLKTEEMTSKKIAEFVTSRALERGYELA
ncbi:MAG TPA: response regulator [Candidatus Acidoferrales bacterium]|nr:response regulator [Candidatus Acidoferrales bacterium]